MLHSIKTVNNIETYREYSVGRILYRKIDKFENFKMHTLHKISD